MRLCFLSFHINTFNFRAKNANEETKVLKKTPLRAIRHGIYDLLLLRCRFAKPWYYSQMKMPMGLGRLKGVLFSVIMVALLPGCAAHRDEIKDAALPPIADADVVRVQDSLSQPIAVNTITNQEQITKFIAFVSALPQQWKVPWYGFGSPIGKVYFYFYKDGTCVGNFYVGPNFFGRNATYTDGLFDFFSEPATKTQIQELSQIVGFDVWKYSRGSPLF